MVGRIQNEQLKLKTIDVRIQLKAEVTEDINY